MPAAVFFRERYRLRGICNHANQPFIIVVLSTYFKKQLQIRIDMEIILITFSILLQKLEKKVFMKLLLVFKAI